MRIKKSIRYTALAAAIVAASSWSLAQEITLYEGHILPDGLVFEPTSTAAVNSKMDLIVTGPNEFYLRKSFDAGDEIEIDPATLADGTLADGTYVYELQIMGIKGISANRDDGRRVITESPRGGSGSFSILGGKLVSPDASEAPYKGKDGGIQLPVAGIQATSDSGDQTRDQVFNDDLIVTGSLCVGFDCVNGESFGFDTIRLKENNVRIKFQDTSNSASFPTNDWQLTANDSANGGANKFSIDDIDNGRTPFTITAGARSHSIFVNANGKVGFGTSTPVVDLHVKQGNTPTLRLEQDGSSGFAAQTWDVASNETNFFIRDATNGSQLPFRIRPSAPTNSIFIQNNGDVGMGTASPGASMHVRGTDGTTNALIEEASGTLSDRQMLTLTNNGGARIEFINTNSEDDWRLATEHVNDNMILTKIGTGQIEFRFANDGDLTIAGSLMQGSSRAIKTAIQPVDGSSLIDKLLGLDFSEWSYTKNPESRHFGPMAEDFFSVFEFGESDKHIAPGDMAGVALAASKELAVQNRFLEDRISELEARLARFEDLDAELKRVKEQLGHPEAIGRVQ